MYPPFSSLPFASFESSPDGGTVVSKRFSFSLKAKEANLEYLPFASPFSADDPVYYSHPAPSLLPRFGEGGVPPWLDRIFSGRPSSPSQIEIAGVGLRWLLEKGENAWLPETLLAASQNTLDFRARRQTQYRKPVPIAFEKNRDVWRFDFAHTLPPNERIFLPPGSDDVDVIFSFLRHLKENAGHLQRLIQQTVLLAVTVDVTMVTG